MRRPAPRYHADAIDVRLTLEPSGFHRVVVETDGGILIAEYDFGQIQQLEEAFAMARRLAAQADGGPDFYNRKTVAIEVRR